MGSLRQFPLRRCIPSLPSRIISSTNIRPSNTSLSIRFSSTESKTEDLIYPDAAATGHSDLGTFLDYAKRTGLDPASTVYVGTHYEYSVASTLKRYGITAKRVGGASDYGIDLVGSWSLPSQTQPIKLLVQCKGGTQKIGPSLIRELEGSFVGAPVGWRGSNVIAFLVSERTATKGVRESLGRSNLPMGFISCSKDGVFRQMMWNRRAEQEGLEAMGVAIGYTESGEHEPQIVLTWQGKAIPILEPSP